MQERINIIYIAGSSYSGSTVLGLVLGSDPKIFNGGELKKMEEVLCDRFKNDPKNEIKNKCSCGLSHEECPFWGKIVKKLDKDQVFETKPGFSLENLKLFLKLICPFINLKKICNPKYSSLIKFIYKNARKEKENMVYLLDNSKSLINLIYLYSDDKLDVKLIVLKRSLISTMSSFRKHGLNYLYGFFSWIIFYFSLKLFLLRAKINHFKMNYEKMCSDTDEVLKQLNKFLSINLNSSNYVNNVNSESYHVLTGNPLLNKISHIKFKGLKKQ